MTTTSRKRAQARQGHRLLTGSLSLLLVSSAAVARPPGGAYASAVCDPDGYDVCQVPSAEPTCPEETGYSDDDCE